MKRGGLWSFRGLLIGLTLLHLLPIWCVDRVPTQDGPMHLETATALLHYSDPGRDYSRFFYRNTEPVPSLLSHVFLTGAMAATGPQVAEKLLLSIYVILFVGGVYWLLFTVDPERTFFTLLAFPMIYNYLLHVGLYGFVISVPLSLLIVAWWWKQEEPRRWRTLLILVAALVLLYFCHLVPVAILCMVLPVVGITRHRLGPEGLLRLAVALLLACVLPAWFLYRWGTDVSHFRPLWTGVWELVSFDSLASFSPAQHWVGRSLGLITALIVVHTVRARRSDATSSTGASGALRAACAGGEATFLVSALLCAALYLVTPENVSEGGFVVERVALYPFLLLLPWLEPRFRRSAQKRALGCALVALTLVHLGQTLHYYRETVDDLGEYTSGIHLVHPDDTILPVHFDGTTSGQVFESHYRVGILWHGVGHYCAEAGAIGLFNIQGNKRLFPLSYFAEMHPFDTMGDLRGGNPRDIDPSGYPVPIDVILVWGWTGNVDGIDEPAELERLTRNYRLVHRTPRLRLYRLQGRKSPVRIASTWASTLWTTRAIPIVGRSISRPSSGWPTWRQRPGSKDGLRSRSMRP